MLRINWLRGQGCGVIIEDLQAIGGELQPSAISDETFQNVACSIIRRVVFSKTLALIGLQCIPFFSQI
jgi:hypothetical protein